MLIQTNVCYYCYHYRYRWWLRWLWFKIIHCLEDKRTKSGYNEKVTIAQASESLDYKVEPPSPANGGCMIISFLTTKNKCLSSYLNIIINEIHHPLHISSNELQFHPWFLLSSHQGAEQYVIGIIITKLTHSQATYTHISYVLLWKEIILKCLSRHFHDNKIQLLYLSTSRLWKVYTDSLH